ELKMEQAGISHEALKSIDTNLKIKTFDVKGGTEEQGEYLKFGLAIFLAYIIFMFIMIYGVKVMRSVVEEKNNRVVEIIISSVKPFNLMMGKILGTTLVALTQFIIWIAMGMTLLFAGSAFFASKMPNPAAMQQSEQMMQNPEWMSEAQASINTLLSMNYPLIIILFIVYFFIG